MHRWTAAELHQWLAEAGLSSQLAAAHSQAAGYWRARTATPQLGPRAHLEAAYHLHRAGELADEPHRRAHDRERIRPGLTPDPEPAITSPGPHTRGACAGLGLVSVAGFTAAFLAVEAANGFSTSHLTSPVISTGRPDQPAASAPLTQANVVRDQAAAWVASEVSAGAIVSCDPVMCAVLVRHGFPLRTCWCSGPARPTRWVPRSCWPRPRYGRCSAAAWPRSTRRRR